MPITIPSDLQFDIRKFAAGLISALGGEAESIIFRYEYDYIEEDSTLRVVFDGKHHMPPIPIDREEFKSYRERYKNKRLFTKDGDFRRFIIDLADKITQYCKDNGLKFTYYTLHEHLEEWFIHEDIPNYPWHRSYSNK